MQVFSRGENFPVFSIKGALISISNAVLLTKNTKGKVEKGCHWAVMINESHFSPNDVCVCSLFLSY